jgi:hypothetical protein
VKTVLNGVDARKSPQKISTIPDEDGGDQTSITQTSRPDITQGQFKGFCLSKLRIDVVQEFLSWIFPICFLTYNLMTF